MLNSQLRAALKKSASVPATRVFIVNPGIDGNEADRYAIGTVTYLSGSNPVDTIIESQEGEEEEPTMRLDVLLATLAEDFLSPDGDVQVFVKDWESQSFAYFDIARIDNKPAGNGVGSVDLILGSWRCGG
jgi:hypothetical protein